MRHVLKLFILLLLNLSVNFTAICSENMLALKDLKNNIYKGFIFKIPSELVYDSDKAWKALHSYVFDFPELLKIASKKNLPILLIIPVDVEKVSIFSNYSPWLEGARVALTWASVYFRFKNLGNNDIRILRTESNNLEVQTLIKCLLMKVENEEKLSAEEQMQNRIFSITDVSLRQNINQKNMKLVPFDITDQREDKNKVVLSPLFCKKKEKKITVVSGASGFIGCHIVKELLNDGHQVIGLDSLICGYEQNLAEVVNNENFRFYKLDISSPFEIEGDIDYVVHLASVPSPEFYYNLPVETLTVGLNGTKQMLELALRKKSRFLFSSTSEVYGDALVSPQSEEYHGNVNAIGKRSQYDESKRGAEVLIKLYYEKYKLDVRIARIFNTYGPYMCINDGRVITNFCKAILENKPMKLYGDGKQTRSFSYISDMVDGLLKLLFYENLNDNATNISNRVFNLGNDQEFTIVELAQKMHLISNVILNKNSSIQFVAQIDSTDPKQRKPDLTKANEILNYFPKIMLNEGIKKTLLYFSKIYNIKN